MNISLENIAHGTRAYMYMQDGKVIFRLSKEMECIPCSIKDDKAIDRKYVFCKNRQGDCNAMGGGGFKYMTLA